MTSRNQQLFERAQKHIPGGVNSPVRAFKSVSVDIPISQLDTADGKEAMRKLNDYARKLAL